MLIRKADIKDGERIIELLYQVAKVHHIIRSDLFKDNGKKYTINELNAILNDEKNIAFVCEDNGVIYGHCFCNIKEYKNHNIFNDYKSLYIFDLCVDEAYRMHGIGKKLCEHAYNYAKQIGCYNITLNVYNHNDAFEFYKKIGFEIQSFTMEKLIK